MPPVKAGEIIVTGVEKDRPRIIVGNDARFMAVGRAAGAGILLEDPWEGPEMIPFLLAGAGGLGLLGGGLAAYSGATARRLEKAVPRDGDLIEVNGQTLHYTSTTAPARPSS